MPRRRHRTSYLVVNIDPLRTHRRIARAILSPTRRLGFILAGAIDLYIQNNPEKSGLITKCYR